MAGFRLIDGESGCLMDKFAISIDVPGMQPSMRIPTD